jgi:hypothetical protein
VAAGLTLIALGLLPELFFGADRLPSSSNYNRNELIAWIKVLGFAAYFSLLGLPLVLPEKWRRIRVVMSSTWWVITLSMAFQFALCTAAIIVIYIYWFLT